MRRQSVSLNFASLLFFSFAIGILLANSIQEKGCEFRATGLFMLLLGGIIYQAGKFYNKISGRLIEFY
jgi:hypothetical protein